MYDAQYIHDIQVNRALWLWARGYITKESHDDAKVTKSSSVIKVIGKDGKFTKTTNFSKDQWDVISDVHMRDVFTLEPEKLRVVGGDIQASALSILSQRKKSSKGRSEANRLDKKALGSGYKHRIASSDSDFWCVPPFFCYVCTNHYIADHWDFRRQRP